ncbi:hypothetical protein [Aestuariivivens insulae]|uniref:hypothetical protein n=1 Tax=Aestuariivivens insulae TaxID=1621988 RepID=UPI001F59EF6A|nr:hypothetical protein [Aestuariivivens insulae]
MNKKQIHNIEKTGFKVPKDYFNNLEDSLLSNIRLKELASSSGFKTPELYFESVEEHIVKKTIDQEPKKVISIFSKQNLIYVSGIAAAVLLLLTLVVFNHKPQWNNLDTETVENYIIDENIDSYEIATLLLDDGLKEADFINYNLKDETIETYLLNNSDIEDLILEKNYNE